MATGPLAVEQLDSGAIWRVAIGGSKGNVLDAAVMAALTELFRDAAASPHLKAICLEGQGAHFSFGASVPEHLPPLVEAMLESFHGALLAMVDSAVPVLAAVRGQCLGGGLELVSLCHRVFAGREARLGQPEIVLGVFAPVASLVLADRVGRGARGGPVPLGSIDHGRRGTGDAARRSTRGRGPGRSRALVGTHAPVAEVGVEPALRGARVQGRPAPPPGHGVAGRSSACTWTASCPHRTPIEGLKAFVERRPAVWRDA